MSRSKQVLLIVCATLLLPRLVEAQPPFGTSTYWLHEQQRLQAIKNQLGTIEHMRWLSGLPSKIHWGRPYSLESIYSGLAWSPGPPAPWKTDVFEPWPFVPGDIYGRQFDRFTPQPVGHKVTPLGPNGYTYQPIYAKPFPPFHIHQAPAVPAPRAVTPPPQNQQPPEELPTPEGVELRAF